MKEFRIWKRYNIYFLFNLRKFGILLKMRTLTGLQAKKYILDPIHKVISLTQIELDIISTPLFQRLRNIT